IRDRIVYESPAVVLGEFRCPRDYFNFAHAGRITRHLVAFPRCAVWIERENAPRFVADPGLSTIYNPDDEYIRAPSSPDGDNSDWIGVSETTARASASASDPSVSDGGVPFRAPRATVSSSIFMAQRRLFRRAQDPSSDRLRIDEDALALVESVIRSA